MKLDFFKGRELGELVMGLMVAGAALKVIWAFLDDVVDPILGALLGIVGGLTRFSWSVGGAEVRWGGFILALLEFGAVLLVIYWWRELKRR